MKVSRSIAWMDPFIITNLTKKPIQLEGEGNVATWTRRALERAGFEINANAEILIKSTLEHGAYKWQIIKNKKSKEFNSIYNLIKATKLCQKT